MNCILDRNIGDELTSQRVNSHPHVKQEVLSESCRRVWGFDHEYVHYLRWKGEKVLNVHYLRRLGKCWVGTPHSHEGLEVGRGS